jgi:hypothetical protein
MISLGKYISLTLIAILALSSLFMLKSADAQSGSKSSTPKFTIQFPNEQTIQIVIENQAFTSSSSVNAIIYYYRVKDHSSQQWITDKDYKLQSDSKTTIITIPSVPGPLFPPMIYSTILNNSTLLDFQVQAQAGYYAISNVSGAPAMISPAPQQWHTEITFNESATSDWSSSLTVDLNEMAVVTPNATPSPSVPEFPRLLAIPLLLSVLAGALIIKKKQVSNTIANMHY